MTIITRDPLCLPWKRTARTIMEATRRRWEVVVALDQRSCDPCKRGISADRILRFTPTRDSCDEMYDAIVRATTRPMVLMVADDEEPSPSLWDFAEYAPTGYCYAITLLTPTPDGRVYLPGTEVQCRLVDPTIWKWVGGIDGHDDVQDKGVVAEEFIMWHFATLAPREVRERKLATYKTLGADDRFGDRHIWERHPDATRPMSADLLAEYPH
jgi:hypothetical protein